jgi:uncharacterized membrane protein YccC
MRIPPVLIAARRGLRQYLSDLRASRAFLAGEVSHAGWLNLGQFRWHDISPGRALRAALGVVAPLVLGVATGHTEYGTFAALGALPTGFVSFRGVTRTRVLLVAITAAGMAISTFVGAATAAGSPWFLVPVIMIWAYVAGICAALGPSAIAVSLQWPVAVLIASAIPLSPSEAAIRAGLVLAGGLWQGALVISSWALSRGSAERTAMAQSYAMLSRYAAELAAGHGGPPPPDTLPGTEALRDPNPLMRSASRQHLIDLMEETERIRTTLTVLGGAGRAGGSESGSGTGPGGTGAPGPDRRTLLAASARSLHEISEALSSRPSQRAAHLGLARQVIGAGPGVDSSADPGTPAGTDPGAASGTAPRADSGTAPETAPGMTGHPWDWASESLYGQLRSAIRITERLNDAEPGGSGRTPRPPVRLPARDLLVTLRASLSTSSEAGRHALRLAVVAGAAEVIAQAAGLPHGYWATLTVLIVLRPDYGSTLYRGLQRAAGTVLGAGMGVATVLLGHFGTHALLIGLGVSLFAAYAVFPVNYLFFAIFLTDFVVVLLALLGLPADQTALDRLAGTGVGTALALIAYVLWPTWERTSASDKFARLILAQTRFADMLLRAYSRPASEEARHARSLKLAARRARIEAETSADRLADEPDRPPVTREFAQALVSVGHRLALSTLALEAAVGAHHAALRDAQQPALAGAEHSTASSMASRGPASALEHGTEHGTGDSADHGAAAGQPDGVQALLDQLAGMVRQSAAQLAESLRRLGPPGPLPPLRELQARIPPDNGDSGALFTAADGLVDALNTAADTLRRYLTPPSSDRPTEA